VSSTGRLLGVEHEFEVHAGAEKVDFTRVIRDLELDGRRLDPGDANAVRCRWGGVVTADGREAEIAIPPVALEPGATTAVLELLAVGRDALEGALLAHDPSLRLRGYSTHLSIEVPDRRVKRIARRFARTHALDAILLIDRTDSPGLLVRPRRNRLELGGEFVDGDDLRAALVFCSAAAFGLERDARRARPLQLRVTIDRAVERYGWFVGRGAFGDHGIETRDVPVRCRRGATTAGAHLAMAWASLRSIAAVQWSPEELALVDDRVGASSCLPFERGAQQDVRGPT
jgi:hypothetical protein